VQFIASRHHSSVDEPPAAALACASALFSVRWYRYDNDAWQQGWKRESGEQRANTSTSTASTTTAATATTTPCHQYPLLCRRLCAIGGAVTTLGFASLPQFHLGTCATPPRGLVVQWHTGTRGVPGTGTATAPTGPVAAVAAEASSDASLVRMVVPMGLAAPSVGWWDRRLPMLPLLPLLLLPLTVKQRPLTIISYYNTVPLHLDTSSCRSACHSPP